MEILLQLGSFMLKYLTRKRDKNGHTKLTEAHQK